MFGMCARICGLPAIHPTLPLARQAQCAAVAFFVTPPASSQLENALQLAALSCVAVLRSGSLAGVTRNSRRRPCLLCFNIVPAALSGRVAQERGEAVGQLVGYSIHGDRWACASWVKFMV